MVSGAPSAGTAFPAGSNGGPVVYAAAPLQQQLPLQQKQEVQQQLQTFWADRKTEIEQITDCKTHSLPLARIKKIMKADEDVQMIAGEAPAVFAKACEMFILELTLRSWLQTRENNRNTLQKNDIATVVSRNDDFDFLVDVMQENGAVLPPVTLQTMVPGMGIPFGMYGNQLPTAFAWPQPEQQPPYNGEQQQEEEEEEEEEPPYNGGQDV